MAKQNMLDGIRSEARHAEKLYRDGLASADNDNLSEKGRQETIAVYTAKYQQTVAALRQRAQAIIDYERKSVQQDLQEARQHVAAERRQLLGDAAMLHIYQRQVDSADVAGVAQLWRESADGWDKALVGELARLRLWELANTQENAVSARVALDELNAAPESPGVARVQAEFNELDAAQRNIEAIVNPVQGRRDAADRLGVDERYVDLDAIIAA